MKALKSWLGRPQAAPADAEALAAHPTMCMMPWVHLHVTQTGHVTPCCQAPSGAEAAFGSVNAARIAEIWNGPAMRKFRQGMRAGKADARCQACYKKEKHGLQSLRKVTNRDYAQHLDLVAATAPDGHLPGAEPIYLDIRFSNVCNFKCRICGPWSSSQWHSDAVALGMKAAGEKAIDKSISRPEDFWAQLESLVPGLEEIYFAGGEPLMMEEHYQLLEMLHRQQKFDLTLKYSTNLSVLEFKDWDVPRLWQPFQKVIVAASLDGSGKRGEFQRKNQDWPKVVAMRQRLQKAVPKLLFLVSPTISIFNVLHVADFHREWIAEGWIGPFGMVPSLLQQPAHYEIGILTAALKAQAREVLSAHVAWLQAQPANDAELKQFTLSQWRGLLNRLTGTGDAKQIEILRQKTAALDKLRNENIRETFPELAELFR